MKLTQKLSFIFALTFASSAWAAKNYQAGAYKVDAAHSKVGFEIPHLVISSVEGSFSDFKGDLQLNKNLKKSKVSFTVNVDSIDTGVDKRDQHLKSADFFDAKKYKTMKFVSTSFRGSPESFKLKGKLTIKNKTKPVVFNAKYLGSVKDGYGNQKVAFSASTKINRKDFGLTWNNVVEAGPVVGDTVDIEIKLQAALQQNKKK